MVLPRRRQGRRGSFRPRQTDRASAKRMRCQGGAAHQLKVRSQGSLLVPSSQRALRAGLPVWIPENPELPEHLKPPKNPETLNSELRTARERSERAANLQHSTANIQQRTFLFLRKDASLTNPINSDARKMLLRSLFPEYAAGTLRLSKGLTLRTLNRKGAERPIR